MADREDEELQMALRMSLQSSPPEAKRSKPREGAEESPEARNRRLQRELMASAAEKRIRATENKSPSLSPKVESPNKNVGPSGVPVSITEARRTVERKVRSGEALPPEVANELFSMVFGSGVSKGILAQWSNQGIRFGIAFYFFLYFCKCFALMFLYFNMKSLYFILIIYSCTREI